MSSRFSRIKSAPRLQTAYTAYKQWQDRVDPYNARPAGSRPGGFVQVAVKAFGIALTDDIIVDVSKRAHTRMGSALGARASATTTGAKRFGGYSPAKAVLFVGTGTSTTKRSDITNLEYQKRAGASYTHAFGAKTATEREYEAFQDVVTVLTDPTDNNAVSYVPERFRID